MLYKEYFRTGWYEEVEIDPIDSHIPSDLPLPSEEVEKEDLRAKIQELLYEYMSPKEFFVFAHRYGLMDGDYKTIDEVISLGEEAGLVLNKDMVRKLEWSGFKKLRNHPHLRRALKALL